LPVVEPTPQALRRRRQTGGIGAIEGQGSDVRSTPVLPRHKMSLIDCNSSERRTRNCLSLDVSQLGITCNESDRKTGAVQGFVKDSLRCR
jgi:hypothetical protein